jgi:hypothetical protein
MRIGTSPSSPSCTAQFYAVIPTEIDVDKFRLAVRGHVKQERSLSLKKVVVAGTGRGLA